MVRFFGTDLLDQLDAKSLAKLNDALVKENNAIREASPTNIKADLMEENRELIDAIIIALNRKGLWSEPEISKERRARQGETPPMPGEADTGSETA